MVAGRRVGLPRPVSRWWGRQSLHRQLVLLTSGIALLVAIGLVLGVQVALAGASKDASRQVLRDRAATVVTSIGKEPGTRLTVPQTELDPGVAVYDRAGAQVAGEVPASMQSRYTELSTTAEERVIEVNDDTYAVLARPFTTASGQRGVIIAAEPFAPYEHTEDLAIIVSAVAGLLLVLVAAGSAAIVSRRALSPVEHMARTADEWSEHDLGRRFALGPPTNEIRALGTTLDGLLDKVASVIRAEQRLTAELAHELRTPLTTIHGVADLLAMRTDLDDEARADVALITDATTTMATTITVLLDLARRDDDQLRTESTTLSALEPAIRGLPLPEGRLELDLPSSLVIDVPQALALRALSPVLTNALHRCDRVRVTARRVDQQVELHVADTGPGVGDAAEGSLFEPGWSGDGGSGLGLALARRVARSGGGDVSLVAATNDDGGATFAVSFPGGPLPPHRG